MGRRLNRQSRGGRKGWEPAGTSQILAPRPPAPAAMLLLRITSTILSLLSLLLLLLALGADYWLTSSGFHMGLWKTCTTSCTQNPITPDYFDATRAFLFLGMFAGFASSITLVASFFRSHLGPVSLSLVSAVGSFSAGLCAMIAMAVFTGETAAHETLSQLTLGWSFGLGWASFPLFLLTGAMILFIPKPTSGLA
ncbi:protein NKG7-like [Carettochelys insculpta]|uniref:protein NKG7-like n=1 Tax=Carettochelys insculpta TaxID=44489 RepID=UPI003EB9FF44